MWVRILVAQVLEPTGLAFDPNHHTVWVNCQRNNALVEVDLDQIVAGTAVQGAWGWGIRNMQATGGINATNNDSPALQPGDNLFGWRQPGDVTVFKYGTNTYAVTANEGEPRPQAASVGTLSTVLMPDSKWIPITGGTTPGPGQHLRVRRTVLGGVDLEPEWGLPLNLIQAANSNRDSDC